MDYYSGYITKLIEELSGLPGIGPKTAGRLAFHILDMPKEQVESLANSMIDAKKNVRYWKLSYYLTYLSVNCHIIFIFKNKLH